MNINNLYNKVRDEKLKQFKTVQWRLVVGLIIYLYFIGIPVLKLCLISIIVLLIVGLTRIVALTEGMLHSFTNKVFNKDMNKILDKIDNMTIEDIDDTKNN